MPKDAFYFKHDANASSDLKLKAVKKNYGWEGCGWFWFLIELLRGQDDYKLEYSQLTWDALADDMGCPPEKVKGYIDYCVDVKLFEKNSTHFSSHRLRRDMKSLDETRELRREAGISSARKRLTINTVSTNAKQLSNNGSTIRVDKSRVDKSRVDIPDFIDKELWGNFLEMRRKLRRPATIKAQELLIKDLEKLKAAGHNPSNVIEQSIKNSWQGFFPLKESNGAHKRNPQKLTPRDAYTKSTNDNV